MVQIKEYTQREGLQPVNRGALNIQKPRIMAEGKGLELSEKPLDTAYQLAKLGVEMKERRDDAMVSEFANQYAIEEAKQINDFKQNYQGLNAYKIMDKYNEWRDDYLAKYSSYDNNSDDDNEHVYLENAEQINKMKNSLARSHVSTINSLSNYIGSQEESARKNALTASIQGYVEKISLEDIPENIELYGENIRGSLAALYKGQSEEFINQKAKSMMNAAVSGNLMRVAAEDPAEAIRRFNTSVYKDNADSETRDKNRAQILKMFIEKMGTEGGKVYAGQHGNIVDAKFYEDNADFFNGVEISEVQKAINEKTLKNGMSLLQESNEQSIALLNGATAQYFEAQEKGDVQAMGQLVTMATSIPGGGDVISAINEAQQEYNNLVSLSERSKYGIGGTDEVTGYSMLNEGEKILFDVYTDRTIKHEGDTSAVIEKINNGEYKSLLDVERFSDFGPEQKRSIMQALFGKLRYDSLLETAKEKSPTDFDFIIDKLYKNVYGKKEDNPIRYNKFRTDMATNISNWFVSNPNSLPTDKNYQTWADLSGQVSEDDEDRFTVNNILREVKYEKGDKIRDRYGNIKAVEKVVKRKYDLGWFSGSREDTMARMVAEKIVDGEYSSAVKILKDYGAIK